MIIIKKIDDVGRIAIPKDLRRSLRWMGGDEIEIIPNDDGSILLRKHNESVLVAQLEKLQEEFTEDHDVQKAFNQLIELLRTKE